ncbi:MAG: hypothetical protein AAB393_11660, partial [Bacteroidota bacterium]
MSRTIRIPAKMSEEPVRLNARTVEVEARCETVSAAVIVSIALVVKIDVREESHGCHAHPYSSTDEIG